MGQRQAACRFGTQGIRGEAPKKCSTFLGGFSHKIIITSTTPIVTPEFSSDLERAPGARSIADENSGVTFGVVELRRCEAYEHFRSHPVLLGTLPQARVGNRSKTGPRFLGFGFVAKHRFHFIVGRPRTHVISSLDFGSRVYLRSQWELARSLAERRLLAERE